MELQIHDILLLFLIIGLIFVIIIMTFQIQYYKNVYNLTEIFNNITSSNKITNVLTNVSIHDELEKMIDDFLIYTFDITIESIYKDMELDNPKINKNNLFISEERKNIILEDVYLKFMERLNPNFLNKLNDIYTESAIKNIILEKFHQKITIYINERNELQKRII